MARAWPRWRRWSETKDLSNWPRCTKQRFGSTPKRKKGGLQFALRLREERLVSAGDGQVFPEHGRRVDDRPAVLRLPALRQDLQPLGRLGGGGSAAGDASCPPVDRDGEHGLVV